MPMDDTKRYDAALQELSRLVRRRNQYLLKLDTLASLPLAISPQSGHIAEFDLAEARAILDSIESETELIQQVAEDLNRLAADTGLPEVQWMQLPQSADGPVSADA